MNERILVRETSSCFELGARAVPWRFNFIGLFDERK